MIGRREKAEILTRYDGIPVWRAETAPVLRLADLAETNVTHITR